MVKLKALSAVALGVGVLTLVTVQAQQGKAAAAPAKASALTPMDYVEIRQLVNRYAFALDTGAGNGCEYADLFAADGEFVSTRSTKGREQLAALARSPRSGPANTTHYIMNHLIEPTADGAVGKEYVIEILHNDRGPQGAGRGAAQRGQGGQAARGPVDQWALVGDKRGELAPTGGHFEDSYTKTAAGWRFKRRAFIPSKSANAAAEAAPPAAAASQSAAAKPAAPCGPAKSWPTGQNLTAMDYLEIQNLVSSYGNALDSGYGEGENGEAYANLYTDDATFGRTAGHDALAKLAREQPRGPKYVRHYLTNHVIEPIPDGAKGKQYLVVIDISESGKPGSIFLGGHYEDTYAKTAEGWRFKTRTLIGAQSGAPAAPAQAQAR